MSVKIILYSESILGMPRFFLKQGSFPISLVSAARIFSKPKPLKKYLSFLKCTKNASSRRIFRPSLLPWIIKKYQHKFAKLLMLPKRVFLIGKLHLKLLFQLSDFDYLCPVKYVMCWTKTNLCKISTYCPFYYDSV